MDPAASVEFSRAARELCAAARGLGLIAPGFRSPPRVVGAARTIRRRPGGAVISVALRGRPSPAVVADMIEGVVVTNELGPPDADRARAVMWGALVDSAPHTAAGAA